MRDLAVVLVTVDRAPRRNYLADTLASLARGGLWTAQRLHSVHVVDSGGSERWPDAGLLDIAYTDAPFAEPDSRVVRVHRADLRRCGKQNYAAALEAGARSGARHAVLLEDDVDVCADFVDGTAAWLDDHAVPACGVYPLCGNHHDISRVAAGGGHAWTYPVAAFWGFQACAWRADAALSFARWLQVHPIYMHVDGREDPEAHDLEIHKWADSQALRHFIGACPSFVQHTGVESRINPGRPWQVTFPSWPGTAWSYRAQKQQQQKQQQEDTHD